ncbi:MAG: HTTM domain-containing protein [Pirellulales bacterium]
MASTEAIVRNPFVGGSAPPPPAAAPGVLERLFGIDPRALAALRIALAAILLVDLAIRASDVRAMYADDGVLSIAETRSYQEPAIHWSLHFLNGSVRYQSALMFVAAVLAMLLLVGCRTRVMTIGSWIMLASIHARAPLIVNGGDVLLRQLLFWSMFLPLGRRWSFDAWLASMSGSADDNGGRKRIVSFATAAILLQVCLVYWLSGIFKLGGPWLSDNWLEGEALARVFSNDSYARPLGASLLAYPAALSIIAVATLIWEFVGPALMFVPWRTGAVRVLAVIGFFLLHLGIELTLTVGLFSYVSMAAWLPFLPPAVWEFIDKRIARERRARQWAEKIVQAARSPWWPRLSARGPSAAVSAIVALLFAYVCWWNAAHFAPGGFSSVMPPAAARIGQLTMTQQKWNMFSQPAEVDGWYVARARLRDGTIVDLLRDGAPATEKKPERVSESFDNHRWRKWCQNLLDPYYQERFSAPLAEYLCRAWDERHDEAQHVVVLDLLYYREDTRFDDRDSEIRKQLFARVERGEPEELGNFAEALKALERGETVIP